MSVARPAGKGRRVAARNRAALIAAARKVFATVGYDAPLSLLGRTAGVGSDPVRMAEGMSAHSARRRSGTRTTACRPR
ncbi:hypothetical protein ACWEPL_33355 [Nonomuraea sp. NPDC004186]